MELSGFNYCIVFKCILCLISALKVDAFKACSSVTQEEELSLGSFPPYFKFGAASSAYQIEGAWNLTDKSESIWDHYVHEIPSHTNGSTGDVTCNSYFEWKKDVQIAKQLGLQFYRFSISWTRLIPNQDTFKVSEFGSSYYYNLINALLESGIEPVVTLYHWDLPQSLQDIGGWLNPLVTDYFAEYARIVFNLYGDLVKTWITVNEPFSFCLGGYSLGIFAPGIRQTDGEYICAKNALIAHAKAYRIYDTEFRHKYRGRVSLANDNIWYQAKTNEEGNITAGINLARQRMTGVYAHPIFSKEGGWPKEFEQELKKIHKVSPLPAFTASEIELVKGTFDFYGLNYYTSRTVRQAKPEEKINDITTEGSTDFGLVYEIDPSWTITYEGSYVALYPEGLRKQMKWLTEQYGNIGIMITEHGIPTSKGLNDEDRIQVIRTHLKEVQNAILLDNIHVYGYTFWSFMDNLEWEYGYGPKFGLVDVDFEDPKRTRTIKSSGYYYKELIQNHTWINRDSMYADAESWF